MVASVPYDIGFSVCIKNVGGIFEYCMVNVSFLVIGSSEYANSFQCLFQVHVVDSGVSQVATTPGANLSYVNCI